MSENKSLLNIIFDSSSKIIFAFFIYYCEFIKADNGYSYPLNWNSGLHISKLFYWNYLIYNKSCEFSCFKIKFSCLTKFS